MKLHTKIQLLKFCFTLLNFVFLALGLSAAGCGVWILFDSSFISAVSSVDLQLVAVVLLAAGALVLVVAVLGLVAAQRESRLLLLPVAAFLLLLILAQIFIAFIVVLNGSKISRTLMETVDKLMVEYPEGEPRLLDNLQHYGECCGREGPSDWLKNGFVQNRSEVLPCSCFRSNRHESGAFCSGNLTLNSDLILYGNGSYSEGCEDALSVWLKENLYTII
uniref:Tetraspanin n=1 Tax=Neogobius melanostomus TaxID=47308 RepID=A0A8C6ULQ3_9GOBI